MFKILLFAIRLIRYRSIIIGNVKIMPGAFLRYSIVKGNITIGEYGSVFRANLIGEITIDEKTSVAGPFTYLNSSQKKIRIGKRCALGPGTTIITSGHERSIQPKSFSSGGVRTEAKIDIGDDVWIGTQTTILGGCKIKNNVTVAAGSVLLGKVYGPNRFYAGVPAHEK